MLVIEEYIDTFLSLDFNIFNLKLSIFSPKKLSVTSLFWLVNYLVRMFQSQVKSFLTSIKVSRVDSVKSSRQVNWFVDLGQVNSSQNDLTCLCLWMINHVCVCLLIVVAHAWRSDRSQLHTSLFDSIWIRNNKKTLSVQNSHVMKIALKLAINRSILERLTGRDIAVNRRFFCD